MEQHDDRTVEKILAVPRQERLNLKSYYSNPFDITTDWDGGTRYQINVWDNKTKELIHQVKVWDDSQTMSTVDEWLELLKTRYILLYQ